jgi:hypothetical protein
MTRLAVAVLLAGCALCADEIDELAARIEALAAKEPLRPRVDTLRRAARMLASSRPDIASHFQALASCVSGGGASKRFPLPELAANSAALERVVEQVEHAGDDPSAYDALVAVIRANQLSAGLDNPSIRARIALADLGELLDPALTSLDGKRVRLSDYRSKTVLLAFWATWCIPCRAELSKLEKIASPDFVVLAVSWEPRETVRDFLREHPYRLAMFIDPGHKLSDRFHVDTLPATIQLEPLH